MPKRCWHANNGTQRKSTVLKGVKGANLFLLERQVHRLALVEHLDAMRGVVGRKQHAAVLQSLPLGLLVLRLKT